jgi:hypothetical protein
MSIDPLTAWKPIRDVTSVELNGSCACGKVKLTIPIGSHINLSGFCHCKDCRRMTGCPFTADFAIPATDLIECGFSKVGTDDMKYVQMTPNGPKRMICKECASYMYAYEETMDVFFVLHSRFDAFQEIPLTFHCNYEDKVVRMPDGLIKYKVWPPMFPGSPFSVLED